MVFHWWYQWIGGSLIPGQNMQWCQDPIYFCYQWLGSWFFRCTHWRRRQHKIVYLKFSISSSFGWVSTHFHYASIFKFTIWSFSLITLHRLKNPSFMRIRRSQRISTKVYLTHNISCYDFVLVCEKCSVIKCRLPFRFYILAANKISYFFDDNMWVIHSFCKVTDKLTDLFMNL